MCLVKDNSMWFQVRSLCWQYPCWQMWNVGAWKMFWRQQKKMHSFNVVFWNVMLNVYVVHRYGKKRFVNFGWMCQITVEIHMAMFVCTQTLWNHASQEDECLWDFDSMASIYIYLHYNWPSLLHTCSLWSWWGHAWQARQAHFFLKMRTYETSISVSRAMLK